jgi:hypothetical protein
MKGDIVLKIIISFMIPFIVLYSFSCIFYINQIGFLTIFNCSISITISYLMFFLRFGKIEIKKVLSVTKFLGTILLIFLCFVTFLLKKLLY